MSSSLFSKLGVSTPFDPSLAFLTSPYPSLLPPRILSPLRILLALFTLAVCITVVSYQAVTSTNNVNGEKIKAGNGESHFLYYAYFTSLSFIGLTVWEVVQAVYVVVYYYGGGGGGGGGGGEGRGKNDVYLVRRWGKWVQLAHIVLFSTIATFPLVVTAVYWALLASSSTFATPFSSFSSITQHILNTLLSLSELLILTNAPPLPPLHLPICIILLGCYLGVAYIAHAAQGVYVYAFLDPSRHSPGILAAYIIGIALAECVAFGIASGLIHLRIKLVVRIRNRNRRNGADNNGGGGGGEGREGEGEFEKGEEKEIEKQVNIIEEEWEEVDPNLDGDGDGDGETRRIGRDAARASGHHTHTHTLKT